VTQCQFVQCQPHGI